MNKQMKVIMVLTLLVASTITVAYADKPEEPNLADLVQSILEYLRDTIRSQIGLIETSLGPTHDSDIKARLDDQDDALDDIAVDIEGIDVADISQHDTDINLRLDDVDNRLAETPVMTQVSGYEKDTRLDAGYHTYWIYTSGIYPHGAIFNVVVWGRVWGTPPSRISVSSQLYYPDPDNPGYQTAKSPVIGDFSVTGDWETLNLEFPGDQVFITARVTQDETYEVLYYVTATYIP